jgi:SAM-dependent methyltransferase
MNIKEVQEIVLDNNPNLYYPVYKNYEELYWGKIPEWIIEYNKDNKIDSCLDIGIAYGSLAMYVKLNTDCDLYGVDFVKYISDDLIRKYDINYKINNIEIDNFPWDKKFNVIIFTEIFEHLNYNPLRTLYNIKNLLTDNGKIFFSTPDSSSAWGKINTYYNSWIDIPEIGQEVEIRDEHIYQYNIDELLEIFKIVGLKIDKLDYSESSENMKHFNIQLSKI